MISPLYLFFYLCSMTTCVHSLLPLPNGDGAVTVSGNSGTLRRIIYNILSNQQSIRNDIILKYGTIENWDTSKVTNMKDIFRDRVSFNGDISKWDVSSVVNMESSTFTGLQIILFYFLDLML